MVNLISSWNPNLFLYLGDVYENGRPMEFDNWYGKPGAAGTYGQFHSITDPAIGNHEYVGSDISGYEWYWNNVPHYYSYDAGGWHFRLPRQHLEVHREQLRRTPTTRPRPPG